MRSQGVVVGFDSIKHDWRNRGYHARWRELSFGQDVMNEAAEETPNAILQRMDVDKPEGGRRCLEHRVEGSL